MIPGQNRGVLEANLAPILKELSSDRKVSKMLEEKMAHFKVMPGEVRGYLNNPKTLYKSDQRVLCLLTEAVYGLTSSVAIKPTDYFTFQEIKTSHVYNGNLYRDNISLPLTLSHFHVINMDYIGEIDIHTMKNMLDSQLLSYNFDIQREPSVKHVRDEIILMPTLNKKNIEEISELINSGELVTTNIVFNAVLGTADDGHEIIYDDKKKTVTIMPGTKIDIVDGYHRCQAVLDVLSRNPKAKFKFGLLLLNTTVEGAKKYQAQLAKQTPISVVRRRSLEEPKMSDRIVKILKDNVDLRGKISDGRSVLQNQLVSSADLADYISEYFQLQMGTDVLKISEYLNTFFTYLVGAFPKELSTDIARGKKKSHVGNKFMFLGYIILASRMYQKDIPADKVGKIIRVLDFTKGRSIFDSKISENKKISEGEISKIFSKLPLEENREEEVR